MLEMSLFRIHRHTGIVAHVLMGAGGDVEQGGLAAVGIAHQGDADHMVPLFGQVREGLVQALLLIHVVRKSLKMLVADEGLAGLHLIHDLDLLRLFPAEGDLIADDFVFDGILQGCIEYDGHFLPLDKPHLDEAFPERTVSVDLDDDRLFSGLKFR